MIQFTPETWAAAPGRCYANFYGFTRWMFAQRRGFKWLQGPHHEMVCNALVKVFRGETSRLIINIPPRYSKTELLQNWIAWCLGRVPDAEFIYTSYSGDLAANNSWQTKEIVSHPEYHRIFPDTLLRADSQARSHWRTDKGGVVYAAGAGGTITGFGAGKMRDGFGGAIIIDDPHKVDEIHSDQIRESVPHWFQNTLESRKNSPHTPIILIMQRLHESDLAGWLLAGGNGEKWEHLCLPALCEADGDPLGRAIGEALWPEKHTAEKLRSMQEAAPFTFSGQYQQSPSSLSGNIFKPDQIQIVDAIPAGPAQWARGWDLASLNDDGDYTAGVNIGKFPDGRLIIADVVRKRSGPDERDAAIRNTATQDGRRCKIGIPQDPGQAGKTQVLYLTRQLQGYTVISSPESGHKVTRAEPFAAQVNVGNVLMLRAPWNEALIREMRLFPNGDFDDQIDACSRAYSILIGPAPINIDPKILRQL